MSISPREYLRHILDETAYLVRQVAQTTRDQFLSDDTLKRAFVRSIEIIGEAARAVPESMREQYPEIGWRALNAMRNRLIHAYFGVDYEIVWDVAANKAPVLHEQIRGVLENGGPAE